MKISSLARFVVPLFVVLAQTEYAPAQQTLTNPPVNGDLDSLGERPPGIGVADEYFAQSFTTPHTNTTVSQVSFYIRNATGSPSFGVNTAGPVVTRLLLTTVVFDANGIHPNQVLFESSPFAVPYTDPSGGVVPYSFDSINVPNFTLLPDTKYAFVLDTAADENLTDQVAARAQLQLGQGYDGGEFFSYRVPWEQTGGVIPPRNVNFAATWSTFPANQNVDMAFQINFVPEPSAVILFAIGLVGLPIYRRIGLHSQNV
jgi:hypothetical protein